MKCTLNREEIVTVGVTEVATKVSQKKDMKHDVPPDLLNALQRAHVALGEAQNAVLAHLRETGQPEPTWG